jgi:flagellar motility protein MotE (MotC chaperone)
MNDQSTGFGNDGPPLLPSQSVSGAFIGNIGPTGNNVAGDLNYNPTDKVEEAVRNINGSDAGTGFSLFRRLSPDTRVIVLCEVRFDKGVGLLAKMRESGEGGGRRAVLQHLARIDEGRLAEFLGPDGVRPQLRAEVAAALRPEKVRVLLARLGASHPASAAQLVEQLAAAEPVPDSNTGPRAAVAVLPADRADRRFLTHLPSTRGTASVQANLPREERRDLLKELSSQELRDRLVLAGRANAEKLIEALPEERAVQELSQVASDQLAPLLASLSANKSAQLMNRLPPELLAAVLGDGSADGAHWLQNADRGLAAAVMEKMEPTRAAACLRRVRAGTAAELLRAPGLPDAWLAEVLAKLPVRLRAALLDRVAMDSQAAAGQLRKALGDGRQPLETGWARADATLTILTALNPALRRLGPRFRGTERLSSALRKEAADARGLWRGMRHSADAKQVNYQAQRNVLATALILSVIALACVIIVSR